MSCVLKETNILMTFVGQLLQGFLPRYAIWEIRKCRVMMDGMSRMKEGRMGEGLRDDVENEDEEVGYPMSEIACVINRETSVSCRRDETDIFIPFSFIHNYFEVYGRLATNDRGQEVFEWSHSYSNVFEPTTQYRPISKFLNFQSFNVEARERVKCISAIEGVPISTQWQSSGYTYPIQIAQYGLSHYSKYLEEPPPKRIVIEDGRKRKASWKYDSKEASISRVLRNDFGGYVMKFNTLGRQGEKGIAFKFVICRSTCRYNGVEHLPEEQHIFYGLGLKDQWRYLTRNFMVDLLKGIAASSRAKKLKKRVNKAKVRLVSLELRGKGELRNISLSSNEHIRHFYDAADWLIKYQDERGGWPIPVARKVIAGLLEVKPGWYSAMAQGQAISLLVRAAYFSGNKKYIESAAKATSLFLVNVTQGGIRTYFPGDYVWYEEYPTSPSLFVLNGFMYSLLGLYDLKQSSTAPTNPSQTLFDEGMKSLRMLLPLFDTGQGSLYDLRHFTSQVAPNLARWDYHTTHITQLLTLATVDSSSADFLRANV
ncbi:D-glucuronyl C5-epimerase [Armadillidium vulgare]|nr:D-glucuronyl C5-epimerase [Armadillidium vulgare]